MLPGTRFREYQRAKWCPLEISLQSHEMPTAQPDAQRTKITLCLSLPLSIFLHLRQPSLFLSMYHSTQSSSPVFFAPYRKMPAYPHRAPVNTKPHSNMAAIPQPITTPASQPSSASHLDSAVTEKISERETPSSSNSLMVFHVPGSSGDGS